EVKNKIRKAGIDFNNMATDYQTRIDDLMENAKIDSEALRKGLDKIRDDYEVTLKQLEYYYNRKKKSNNEMLEAFAAKLEKLEDERRDLVMQRLDEANLKLVKENSVVEEEKETERQESERSLYEENQERFDRYLNSLSGNDESEVEEEEDDPIKRLSDLDNRIRLIKEALNNR
ncbi:MAG: hypothetical protein IIZ11_03070, partial [Erysipelotrichaceae bacterium]|nr:hypothetical protein [Erysipelotrichaceae bacterium]